MRAICSVLVFLFMISVVEGQESRRASAFKNFQSLKSLALKNRPAGLQETPYKEIDGTPYYFESISMADLTLNSEEVIEQVPMRIDLYAEEMIARESDNTLIYLDAKYYKEISIKKGDETFVFKKLNPEKPEAFFQVLVESEGLIFLKTKSVDHVEMSMIVSGQRQEVNKFNPTEEYFLVRDGKVTDLSLKKKKFYKSFSKKEQSTMKAYEKSEKLNLKEEAEFVALIKHLIAQN